MMMTPFIEYVSLTTAPRNDRSVLDIFRGCDRFNSAHNVTGFLHYDGVRFYQRLEGEEFTISRLLERIRLDWRHSQMSGIVSGETVARQSSFELLIVRKIEPGALTAGFAARHTPGELDKRDAFSPPMQRELPLETVAPTHSVGILSEPRW